MMEFLKNDFRLGEFIASVSVLILGVIAVCGLLIMVGA